MSNFPGQSACRYAGISAMDYGEVRTNLLLGRIARVIFCVRDGRMVLLHGFMKKTQKTAAADRDTALKRMKALA
ncbi:MAG TPA: type II toxin-antitoxin system RelE/ParE family toxin [Xanthobacteraceae bacterium]|nr:type II toxin-antitoxin system RelE/ParE family toxin [Xanthobacteraceae bacterium]